MLKSQVIPDANAVTPKKGARADIIRLLDELYEDSIISSYGHDLAAEHWNKRYLRLGITTTALSAIVSASIFSTYESLALVAGFISLALVVISSIATFLNSEQKSNSHTQAKLAYREIGDRVMLIKKMYLPFNRKRLEEICTDCDKLIGKLNATSKNSPRLSSKFWHLGEAEWDEDLKQEEEAEAKRQQKKDGARVKKEGKALEFGI